MNALAEPESRFYSSQGLKLHYADWGNLSAPPLILLHGGRDHCRSWDAVARVLQPHFHVMAPDLRGHGDSDWALGSSYSLADHVYDLTPLAPAEAQTIIVGHSFGGMISLAFAGTFPERVQRLAILDGAFLPEASARPIEAQMAHWIGQLDKIGRSRPRIYDSIAEAGLRMRAHNGRLSEAQALHLASHAVKPHPNGGFVWKYDPYQRARAPYRLLPGDYTALWSRIACPTLLLAGGESTVPDPARAGILKHFRQAQQHIVAGAGHWLQHDRLDEVLMHLRGFLGLRMA